MSNKTVRPTTAELTRADRWDHVLARLGWRRGEHRVEPGLYAVGHPNEDSPVLVTANYTLSFDALREALAGFDAYILVLDTKGVNVWCAAGKGTFGTEELVGRLALANLHQVVRHRRLILPQLGATGISAREVERRSGFKVEYGPVRARDIGEYLRLGRATAGMRRVRFDWRDRAVLVPVEVVNVFVPTGVTALAVALILGPVPALATVVAVASGVVGFPLLLPWLPSVDFSTKGAFLGLLAALPFAGLAVRSMGSAVWLGVASALQFLLVMPAVSAFLALNFTGATPFTSRSGVESEMAKYIRPMAAAFGSGLLLAVFVRLIGLRGV